MKYYLVMLLLICPLVFSDQGKEKTKPPLTKSIKVASIQFCSEFGKPETNRKRLASLIKRAALKGAKIIVLPEAAIPGYCDITREIFWSSKKTEEKGYRYVEEVAESVPGISTKYFSSIAKKYEIYLTVPIIEKYKDKYFNTVVLLDPDGNILLHYRKIKLWPYADLSWATEGDKGDKGIQVIDTPYGRLGIMICYDIHKLLPEMNKKKVDIVLYSVAWYGHNSETWFDYILPQRVKKYNVILILANWSFYHDPGWSGYGYSCIIDNSGKKLAETDKNLGDSIVIADIKVSGLNKLDKKSD